MQKIQTLDNTEPKRSPKTKKSGRTALWLSLASMVVLLPLMLASSLIVAFQVLEWNLPNVQVYDLPVGRLTPEETQALINQSWNLERKIHLVAPEDPETSLWLTPQELGYWVDPAATAQSAYLFGRGAEPFKEVLAALRGEERTLLPILSFDETTARETLEKLAENLTLAPQEARVEYQSGQWVALPGSSGKTVDIETTLAQLNANAFTNLVSQSAPLYLQSLNPNLLDLSFVVKDIEAVIVQEMTLSAYDPILDETFHWSVSADAKRSWVSVDPDSYEVRFSIPRKEVKAQFDQWEKELGEGRHLQTPIDWNAVIAAWQEGEPLTIAVLHNPTTYKVNVGETLWSISLKLGMPLWHILDANPGLTINNLSSGMVLDIPSKNVLLPLPPVPEKRIIIDISEQRMRVYENGQVIRTHVVSTGVSDSPTMAGIFQVQSHEINAYASNWDLFMPHFLGIYEAWPGFMNGIHGLPLLSSGSRLWASSLGSPASYGCIILDLAAAEELYYWADPGVVVEITR